MTVLQTTLQRSIQLVPWRLRAVIKQLPVVAPLQRWLLRRFLEGREFVHEVNAGPAMGLKTSIILPEDKGIWTGTYELEFIAALASAVKPGDICFDVGGWHGFCGGVMAVNGASHTVIFEPMPTNCDRIRKLIKLNPALSMQLVPRAVGHSDGTAVFEVLDADSMGKLAESSFQTEVTGRKSIRVDLVSLDTWCEQSQSSLPTVIKIDVEGAELMVLRGATRTIIKSKPILFIEAHSRDLTRDVTDFLRNIGYYTKVLETGLPPNGESEPEICHLVATHENSTHRE